MPTQIPGGCYCGSIRYTIRLDDASSRDAVRTSLSHKKSSSSGSNKYGPTTRVLRSSLRVKGIDDDVDDNAAQRDLATRTEKTGSDRTYESIKTVLGERPHGDDQQKEKERKRRHSKYIQTREEDGMTREFCYSCGGPLLEYHSVQPQTTGESLSSSPFVYVFYGTVDLKSRHLVAPRADELLCKTRVEAWVPEIPGLFNQREVMI